MSTAVSTFLKSAILGHQNMLIFVIIGAVAEMERQLLVERTQSGLAAARARGRVGGRRRSFTTAQQHEAQRLYDLHAMTMQQIAAAVGSSPSTIYRYLSADGRPPVDQ